MKRASLERCPICDKDAEVEDIRRYDDINAECIELSCGHYYTIFRVGNIAVYCGAEEDEKRM